MDYKLSRGRRLVQAVHDANGNNERNENISAKENINDYQKCIPEVQQTLPVIVLTEDSCFTDYVSLNSFNMEEEHLPSTDHIIPRCVPSSEQEVLPIQLEFAHDTNSESSREQIIYLEKTNDSQEPITLTNTHDDERPLSSSLLKNESDKFIDPNNHNMNEGRKRRKKADPSQWKRNINKKLRMEGKAYLGFRKAGSTVIQDIPRDERKIKPTCMSTVCANSKKRNCQYFTQEQRESIYQRFWGLTWGERKAFVCGYVTKIAKKTNTTDGDSRRNFTLIYNLNNGQQNYQVCRDMFLNTLGIGYRMVQSWVNDSSHGIPATIKIKDTSVNNVVRSQEDFLSNFLDSLPKMPSHYNRQNSSKLYLEPVLQTIKDVYKLYLVKCNETGQPSFSRKKFSEVMSSKNISLFNVKKDKCNLCACYEAGNLQEESWKEHIEKKEKARKEKQEDIEKANRGEIILIEVDFQAVKLAPLTHANAFYYKTKLACHNFTIYDIVKKQSTCYWFSEDQNNQLVASTFVSCLIYYLKKKCITAEKKPIIIFSDGCTAQKRNNVMANALLNFSMLHGVLIYQKYLEVGHTQMEVDSVHACIERKLKKKEIKLPSDYVSITREAREKPTPYEAIDLTYDFFRDYTKPLRYNSIRPGRMKHDPTVTDIKVISYHPSGIIKVKLDFSEELKDLPQRPKQFDAVQSYPPLFTARCCISKTKWLHLQELKSVIPKDCHYFYDNLPCQG
ncbi:unnamed protein product [Diatraea saccharalis]|uniref:Uncharacterized protein n=1 Tax=Diatraea saccharalis TaxID=40085 RepID=A0A9N9R2P4_9NEOP|nr:unnamed protein product [Diatraea saccharalis]